MARLGRAEGDIVNCQSVLGKMGSLSVSSYSPHSMGAIHYVPIGRPPWPALPEAVKAGILTTVKAVSERDGRRT